MAADNFELHQISDQISFSIWYMYSTHWRTHKPSSLRLHLLWKILFQFTFEEKISEDKTILSLIWSKSVYSTSSLSVTDNNSCSMIMFWWANTIECSANTRPIECEYFINYKEDLYSILWAIMKCCQPCH